MPGALQLVKEALKRARAARTLGYTKDVYHGTRFQPGSVALGAEDPALPAAGKGFNRFRPDSRHDMGIHVGDTPHAAQGIQYHWASLGQAQENLGKARAKYREALEFVRRQFPDESPWQHDQRAKLLLQMGGYIDPQVGQSQLANLFDGAYTMPLKARMRNMIDMPDLGNWSDPEMFLRNTLVPVKGQNRNISLLSGAGQYRDQKSLVEAAIPGPGMHMPDPMFRDMTHFALENFRDYGTHSGNEAWKNTARDINKDYGVDTWRYMNLGESKPRSLPPRYGLPGSVDLKGRVRKTGKQGYPSDRLGQVHTYAPQYSYVLFDPDQLRLPWAEFDPAWIGSGRLDKRKGGLVQLQEQSR